jgi:hypothetical protein
MTAQKPEDCRDMLISVAIIDIGECATAGLELLVKEEFGLDPAFSSRLRSYLLRIRGLSNTMSHAHDVYEPPSIAALEREVFGVISEVKQ